MLRPTEPISAGQAAIAVNEMERTDPRLAATVDTVWDRLARPDLDSDTGRTLMDFLCCAVLAHYGYPLRGVDLAVIPAEIRSAVKMARIPEPSGCRHCGVVEADHGVRTTVAGRHQWTEPREEQKELRVRALILQEQLVVHA